MKKILFICKHNLFRSRVAEILFNRMNKNKNYMASSAGIILWNEKDLKGDSAYTAEKKVGKRMGINLKVDSKPVTFSILRTTNLLIIVADDVPKSFLEIEKSFKGKMLVWKIPDVKSKDKNKEKAALKTINFIDKKVKELIKKLK